MTPEAKAIQDWFESEEGRSCGDPTSLKAPAKQANYLRSRLWRAFTAGMRAGRRIERDAVAARFRRLFLDEDAADKE